MTSTLCRTFVPADFSELRAIQQSERSLADTWQRDCVRTIFPLAWHSKISHIACELISCIRTFGWPTGYSTSFISTFLSHLPQFWPGETRQCFLVKVHLRCTALHNSHNLGYWRSAHVDVKPSHASPCRVADCEPNTSANGCILKQEPSFPEGWIALFLV